MTELFTIQKTNSIGSKLQGHNGASVRNPGGNTISQGTGRQRGQKRENSEQAPYKVEFQEEQGLLTQ